MISGVTVSGAGFGASGVASAPLTPNQSVPLNVQFAPGAQETLSAQVNIISNAPNAPNLLLSGIGTMAATYTISGTISPAAGGGRAIVRLTGASSASATADGSGNYIFTGLANGSYTVTPSSAGYTVSPSSQAVTINAGNATGVNFASTATTYTISGTISPTAGGSGAVVTLSGAFSATTTSDSSGNYTFPGLASGAYTVTPSNDGYAFSPSNQSVAANGASVQV